MNDKEILNDILNDTKALCDLYMHGTIESNCEEIHSTFKNVLNETLTMQKETYQTMVNSGWYKTEQIPTQKIEQAKQKLSQA